jgi:hypothetical protein
MPAVMAKKCERAVDAAGDREDSAAGCRLLDRENLVAVIATRRKLERQSVQASWNSSRLRSKVAVTGPSIWIGRPSRIAANSAATTAKSWTSSGGGRMLPEIS